MEQRVFRLYKGKDDNESMPTMVTVLIGKFVATPVPFTEHECFRYRSLPDIVAEYKPHVRTTTVECRPRYFGLRGPIPNRLSLSVKFVACQSVKHGNAWPRWTCTRPRLRT